MLFDLTRSRMTSGAHSHLFSLPVYSARGESPGAQTTRPTLQISVHRQANEQTGAKTCARRTQQKETRADSQSLSPGTFKREETTASTERL